jgi:competence protein ComFC
MKCISCESFSFTIICKQCQNKLLKPTLNKRELDKDFYVYSFYGFEQIEELIESKYYFYGDKVFKILSELTFRYFAKNFSYIENVVAIAINDNDIKDFSCSAILTKELKMNNIDVDYVSLKATNKVKYAGKTLDFRKQNPRKFIYSGKRNKNVILVDDVVTTGTTILEAKKTLEKYSCNVLFALTLADARF